MAKAEKGGYSEERIEQMEKTRDAADITIARIRKEDSNRLIELDAGTDKKRDKQFVEATKEFWREFAVHGMEKFEKGKVVLKNNSDLDGECSLALLRLAGIDTSEVEYVSKGDFRKDKINIDTGDQSGLVVKNKGKTAFFDHHGKESKNDTCATKVTYETLVSLGLLKKTDYLDKTVDFVTYVDNKTFPDEEKHFEDSDRTILGLQRFIKDPNMLIDFFKKRKGPVEKSSVRVLSDAELKQMGLTSASGDQRKAIDKSIEKLEEYENNGMIIDSDDYGRIVVDIGKEVPCGFDAAKFWGCGAYLNWSPEMGSFFISTVDDLQHKFSQGKPVRQTMWIKPPKDPRPLKINLEKILSTLTNGKLEAEGELEDYLETVDLLGDSGKINKNNNLSKDMAKRTPEAAPKPPEEIKNLESAPFEEGEKEVVQSMTERYGAEHKIDEETMDAVSGFLSKDHEKAYQDFALQWFQDNQDKVKERIGNIPPNASEDWKINMVLSKEGMNASAEINNPEYKDDERYEAIIKKIGRIRVLETGIKKEPPSPETPFLLLNYLQASVEGKRKEVRKLRAAEARGNENAGIEADSKENEIKEVFGTMKELTEKTMDEDLRGNAEEKVVRSRGFEEKEDSVASGINAKKIEVEDRRNDELMTKEWERFSRLPEQQRGKYQKQLKLGEGVLTKATFGDAIKMAANRDSGINGQAFYAMLEQGLRPYEATTSRKKYLLFGPRTVTMARQNGTSKEMSVKERDATIESSKTSYTEKIGLRAQTELEDTWEKDFEKKINIEIEKRVKVIAESPGTAEEEVEKIYEEARQRIITEYALKQANKVPKTKEQLAEIKKNFEEKAEGKNVNDFMSAALFKKGRLENLGDDFDENDRREMGGFLRDWGFKADKNTMGFITPAEYKKASKTQMGFFDLIMKVVQESLHPGIPKVKTRKRP